MVDPSEKSIDMSQMQGKFSFFSLLRPWLIRLSVQLNLLIGLSQAVLTQQNGQRNLGTQIFLKMSLFTSLGSLILSLVEFILKRKRMQRKVVWLKRGFIWQEQVSGTFSLYFGIISSTIQFVINFVAVMVNKNVVQFNTVSLLLSISYLITEMIAPGETSIVIGRIQGNFPFFSLSISSDSSILINEFQQILSRSSVPLKAGLNSKSFKGEVCQNSLPKMLVRLIEPDMISDIQQIVHLMTDAGYRNQCWDVYRSCRMDALKSCLGVLGLGFHFFGGTDWRNLVDAKKWIEAFRIMVKVLLLEKKRLCKEIFDGSGLSNPWSWEIGGLCLYQLLRYGEDAAFCRKQHLKELPRDQLLIILKMYEALRDTLPYLEGLLSIGSGEFVCSQAKRLLDKLGKAANRTLTEFENVVKNEDSKNNLVPTGMEIHPHGNDVMNYVKSLVKGHGQTLNSLLGSYEVGEITPLGCRLIPLIFSLEFNLKKVAEFYKDKALQYIFLMNNKHYIVQEVMCSVLGNHLGDDWIHKHHTKIHTYAEKYLKASWSKVLSCLIRDESIGDSSSETFKMTLKERFKNFNTNFEEIYKTQATWKILDLQLRTEVQTSISKKVIPAYRSFLEKSGSQLESEEDVWKYIKYTPEDLEWYLADLFKGPSGVLQSNEIEEYTAN